MRQAILTFAFFAAFLANIPAQQLYYSVKFPDDKLIQGCGAYPDTSDYPVIQYFSNCNFNVGISVKDQVFNINNTGGCKKILRIWKLIWWCDYDPNGPGPTYINNPDSTDIGPTVMGDSGNHGYLQYVQILKVTDNVPPVFLNCPDTSVTFCDYTDNDPAQYGNHCEGPVDLHVSVTDVCSKSDISLSYRLYLDLDGNGSMETYLSSSAPNAWPIVKTVSGDTVSAAIKLPAGVGIPYGTHKVEWIANDGCGNQSVCKYSFIVNDCKAPTVVCLNGLSVNIMPTGMITFWATDFLQYAYDNCTPDDLLKIAIRKSGTGTGFPAFQTSVTFDCNEIGTQPVEIWAEDASGNAAYCETYLIVQDHFGACNTPGPVTGNISTQALQAVPGAKVLLKSNLPAIQQQAESATDTQGNFSFASAPGTCNYSIIPDLDTLPLLGVNTLDMLLAHWHINGTQSLSSPYDIIAADVNRDGQVNAADMDAMRDLILGISDHFPNAPSWRFVPTNYVFPNPQTPLATTFPEKISTVCPLASNAGMNFTAIKTGDVDASADPSTNFNALADERGDGGEQVYFKVVNRRFGPGAEITVMVTAPELSNLLGFQFTFGADPETLQLLEATPMLQADIKTYASQNRVAICWYTKPGENAGAVPVLRLRFKTLKQGTLKTSLFIDSAITRAETYDQQRNTHGAALLMVQPSGNSNPVLFMPVSPNPTHGNTVQARFSLSESAAVSLVLSDLNGTVVSTNSGNYDPGTYSVEMPVGRRLGGMYSLRLETVDSVQTQRVVVQQQ